MKMKNRFRLSPGMNALSKWILNKYSFATLIFLVWLSFFDRSAFVTQWRLNQTIDRLESEREFLIEETEASRLLQRDITENEEKYAREKYFMKKPGEQVFIIE